MTNRLAVQLPGLDLQNPIMPASGTVYYGLEWHHYDLNLLGALVTKTTTVNERRGNPQPWIVQSKSGILNSVGLANPGIDKVKTEFMPEIEEKFTIPVMASIAGETVQEYIDLAREMNAINAVKSIEVNLSCPNVDRGGMEFGVDADSAFEVIEEVAKVTNKPIYAKLSPNVTDIKPIALAVEDAGAAGIVLINTVVGMSIDLSTRSAKLARGTGGLSGTPVHPIAVKFVYETAQVVSIPIIGVGGVESVDDALELLMAGASAIQIGTANINNPHIMKKIVEELPAALDTYHFDTVVDVTNTFKGSQS